MGISYQMQCLLRRNHDSIVIVLGFAENEQQEACFGSLWSSRTCGILFLVKMPTVDSHGSIPCSVSLPSSLGLAAVFTSHICKSVHQVSLLLLAKGSVSYSQLSFQSGLSLPGATSCRVVFMSSLSSSSSGLPHLFPIFLPLDASMCGSLRHACMLTRELFI